MPLKPLFEMAAINAGKEDSSKIRNIKNNQHSMDKQGIDRRRFFCQTVGVAGAITVAYSLPFIMVWKCLWFSTMSIAAEKD
jgi:hypothetical protein